MAFQLLSSYFSSSIFLFTGFAAFHTGRPLLRASQASFYLKAFVLTVLCDGYEFLPNLKKKEDFFVQLYLLREGHFLFSPSKKKLTVSPVRERTVLLLHSLLFSQQLEQSLERNRCSINVCWMNKRKLALHNKTCGMWRK